MQQDDAVGVPGIIEVRLTDVRQLFESMDPTPFPGKDLDPAAAEYIVSWAREFRHTAHFVIRVHVSQLDADAQHISAAISSYFLARAEASRLAFRRLMAIGRRSLVIGLAFLTTCLWVAEWLESTQALPGALGFLREGLVIGSWVALWRPLQIFLYDWWPLRADRNLYLRLADASVEIAHVPTNVRDRTLDKTTG